MYEKLYISRKELQCCPISNWFCIIFFIILATRGWPTMHALKTPSIRVTPTNLSSQL